MTHQQSVQQPKNGIIRTVGQTQIEVTALRDDIIRVRIATNGAFGENASWAVMPEALKAGVPVTRSPDGFQTRHARVSINQKTGAISIFDGSNTPVLADTPAGAAHSVSKGFRITKSLPADAHIFGLGDKPGPLDRRGNAYQNWNTDTYAFQEGQSPTYKDIPFFIMYRNGQTSGVFLDNTWRSVFDFGVNNPAEMSFGADGGSIDYYVFTGPTPKDVVSAYAWLTGTAPLPPLWSLGYQQSRYTYGDKKAVLDIANRLRKDKIPADVIWFDIGALDQNRPFTIDKKAFPDFKGLIKHLKDMNFHTVIVSDLHVAKVPNANYKPYDEGTAKNVFVHNPDGSVYSGPVWPGAAVFPDFMNTKAREYWGEQFRTHYLENGVSGYWNDMNEPSIFTALKTMPNDLVHRIEGSGFKTQDVTHEAIHNVYGSENGRATYEGLLKLKPDQRPFVMMRAAYAGGQRYSTTWTGDTTSTWNHLRLSTPMLLNLGLSGFGYVGDNLGGFVGSPAPDLLTRWLQIGMFNPIAQNHSDAGSRMQEPWVDGPDHENIRRRFIEARYRMMPYIYTIAEEQSRNGIPMMRPLFLEFPESVNGSPIDLQNAGEFMWGPSLLVAPAQFGEQLDEYKVLLPPGDWYDYWTGQKINHAEKAKATGNSGIQSEVSTAADKMPHTLMIKPKLDELPVYARAGTIIPHQALMQNLSETPKGNLELHVYAAPEMAGSVYADDGNSMAYKRGSFFRQSFNGTFSDGTLKLIAHQPNGEFKPWWSAITVTVHGINYAPTGNTQGVQNLHYDAGKQTLTFVLPTGTTEQNVTLNIAQ